jgi:DNA repair exonuclease SbcCD ATPase subunit
MAPRRSKLDTEIQRLYGLPLGEFTAARNALAKQLRKDGNKEGAEEVASLPKPTVSAWAVNHLFTTDSERMEELLASGERARKALRAILSGGDPGALRDAIQEARDLANELRDSAAGAVAEETRKPGPAIVDRIATNLQSLAFSPAAEPVIERGWMDVDLPPVGFEVLAGLQLADLPKRAAKPPKPAPAPEKKPAEPAPKPAPKVDRQAEAKERREREAAEARERREKETARAQERQREKLDRAHAQREEAAGRADFLRRKAEQAEKSAEDLRQRLEEAERLAAEASKRADEAEKLLAKAEKAVKSAKVGR